jgi:hypothetical protein
MAGTVAIACASPTWAAADLLQNGGFESPAIEAGKQSGTSPSDWQVFSSADGNKIGLTSKLSHGGKQAVRAEAQGIPGSFQGLYQVVAVEAGAKYHFRVFARNDSASPVKGPMRGQISIEWKDSSGTEIDRTWGPDWGTALASDSWKEFEITATAPSNAVKAHFVITQHDGAEAGAGGAFIVDDAEVAAAP